MIINTSTNSTLLGRTSLASPNRNTMHSSVDQKEDKEDSSLTLQPKSSKSQKKDSLLDSLQSQLATLEEEKKNLANNTELSDAEKIAKSRDLTKQISEVNKQINTRQMEIQKEEREKEIQKSKEKEQIEKEQKEKDENPNSLSSNETSTLVKAGSLLSDVSSLNSVRTHASGEAHRIQGAIAANISRDDSSGELEAKLSQAQNTINSVTHDMVKKYGEIQSNMKQYLKSQKDVHKDSPNNIKDKDDHIKSAKEKNEDENKNINKTKTSFNEQI